MADDTAVFELHAILDALDDVECRSILEALTETPDQSVAALAAACDLSRSSAYRKVDRLDDAGLVKSHSTLRDDGRHTTVYRVAFDGVYIGLSDEGFEVTLSRTESPDERLARFWESMKDAR